MMNYEIKLLEFLVFFLVGPLNILNLIISIARSSGWISEVGRGVIWLIHTMHMGLSFL